MNIEEVDEPETTEIYRQNPLTPAAAARKLYENSQTKRTCKRETTKIAMNSARHPSATSI